MSLDYIIYLISVTRLNKHRQHIKAKYSCLKLAEVAEFYLSESFLLCCDILMLIYTSPPNTTNFYYYHQ